MKILLVEDDNRIADPLVEELTDRHHVVELATDGEMGLELALASPHDLILLDIMLPKLDGLQVCRQLRDKGDRTPILMLTARDEVEDRVAGLDVGADDYLVKPFALEELFARVRALGRRGAPNLPPVLEWGPLRLDPSSRDVTYDSTPVSLSPKEYGLLELFLRNGNRVFSRAQIIDHLWTLDQFPEEATIKAHIRSLRQKLKAAGAPEDFIETLYGSGYRLKPL
ncbi:response regulator transcription factor [Pannus brasiliensis CCIBt3594]|uniref:Response regulator transcription factor n=1 Tax=Pannus brasiliensis CCIBt3594 TaxID=1427578 RepID=A0AAW9QQF4_9CHRO